METVETIQKVQGTRLYEVNLNAVTCTCPHFKFRCSHHPKNSASRICKHLKIFEKEIQERFSDEVRTEGLEKFPRATIKLFIKGD